MSQLPPPTASEPRQEPSSRPGSAPAVLAGDSAVPSAAPAFRPLSAYARWVVILFSLIIVLHAADMYYSIGICNTVELIRNGLEDTGEISEEYSALWEGQETKIGIIAIANVLAGILCCLFFCLWGYRAAVNAVNAAHKTILPLELRPGLFIGSFFIPVFNLWGPYMGMKRVYNISCGRKTPGYQKFSGLVAFWWASFLVMGVTGRISFKQFRDLETASDALERGAGDVDGFLSLYLHAHTFSQAGNVIVIISAVASLILVRRITRAQMEMHGTAS